MSATPRADDNDYVEAQWRAALVRAEQARQDYAQCLRAANRDESELGRLWLRLWLAPTRCAGLAVESSFGSHRVESLMRRSDGFNVVPLNCAAYEKRPLHVQPDPS
jgi:hypothetical protein